MLRLRYRVVLALGVWLGGVRPAQAQVVLSESPAGYTVPGGRGIALGDQLVLHPGIGLEYRYDSNVFFFNSNPVSASMLRALASLDLATRPTQRGGDRPHTLDFRVHAGADYREYLTGDDRIRVHRGFGIQASLLATLFPGRPFMVDVFDEFVRTAQPPYAFNPYNYDRDVNLAGVRLRYRPGGGRLSVDLSYIFGLDFFEVRQLRDFDVLYHLFELRSSWKFLPKTAVFVDVRQGIYSYQNPGVAMHPDSLPLRVSTGLMGLITAKLTTTLWIGYGNGFYKTGPSPGGVIGAAEVRWQPTILTNLTLGYEHDFQNSLLGSYFDLDKVHLAAQQLLWRFTANLRFTYEHINFNGITAQTALVPVGTRTDNYFAINFKLDYPLRDWLIASAGYDLQVNSSSSQIQSDMLLIPVNYTKHEGWLRLSVLY